MTDGVGTQEWWRDPEAVSTVTDYALLNQLLYRSKHGGCTNVSMSLRPAKYPRKLFEKAIQIQEGVNALVDVLSKDKAFLSSALKK